MTMTRQTDLAELLRRRPAVPAPQARPLDDDHPARRYRLGQQARFTWAEGDTVVGWITELHQDRVEITRVSAGPGPGRVTRHRCTLVAGTLEVPDLVVGDPRCTHAALCPVHAEFVCPPTTLRPGDAVAIVAGTAPDGAWGTIVALRSVGDDPYNGDEQALIDRGDDLEDDDITRWYPVGMLRPLGAR